MPDITFPNVVTTLQAPVAADIAENLYTPRSTPNTLGVANGFLSRANLAAGALPLQHSDVRPGAFSGGRTVGATANQDFFADWYVGATAPRADIDRVGLGIPGASMTYELPYACTVLYLRWQVGIVCDGGETYDGSAVIPYTDSETAVLLKLYVDGEPVDTYRQGIIKGRVSVPDRAKTKWNYYNDMYTPDHRWWTCEAAFYATDIHSAGLAAGVRQPRAQGLHTAIIRIAHDTNVARVKVRNMTFSYLR